MSDGAKKSSKWVKVLDEAGLLDEIEDGWSLPPGQATGGGTIRVKGEGGKSIPPDEPSGEEEEPSGVEERVSQAPAIVVGPQDDQSETRESRAKGGEPERRHSAPMIPVSSAKETAVGLPTMPGGSPLGAEPEPQRAKAPVDEAVEAEARPEPVIEDRGSDADGAARPHADGGRGYRMERVSIADARRITVAPETPAEVDGAPAIIDDPAVDDLRPPLSESAPAASSRLQELVAVGDFSGALALAEEILESDPGNFEAARVREECRDTLIKMYESRIGEFDRVPQIVVTNHELIWRDLDPATGFVLSRIDGFSTFEDILDISGLSRFETCKILDRLLQDGIIG